MKSWKVYEQVYASWQASIYKTFTYIDINKNSTLRNLNTILIVECRNKKTLLTFSRQTEEKHTTRLQILYYFFFCQYTRIKTEFSDKGKIVKSLRLSIQLYSAKVNKNRLEKSYELSNVQIIQILPFHLQRSRVSF